MSTDQRITLPKQGMAFGNSTVQLIEYALNTMPAELRDHYEAVLVMAASSGGLRPVWKIGQKHKDFPARCYGKVTFTRKAQKNDPVQIPLF